MPNRIEEVKRKEQIRDFKDYLRHYRKALKEIPIFENMIQKCYQELGGYKSPIIFGVRTKSPPNKDREYELRALIDEYEDMIKAHMTVSRYVVKILTRMKEDDRNIILDVYVKRKTIDEVAFELGYAHSTMCERIDEIILKALNSDFSR